MELEMWNLEKDGTVMDARGNVVVFSAERFMKDVIAGNACFLCGVAPTARPFKNLLVLPEWLLKRYDLAAKTVQTARGATLRYDENTVPCCQSCNILVNDEIERPVCDAVSRGGDALNDYVAKNGLAKIYIWLALVFVKTHLKDNLARYSLAPAGSAPPALEWGKLHLVHSMVRGHLANIEIDVEATGSFMILPVNTQSVTSGFDYADLYGAQTAMVRFDGFAVFTVFDDTGAAMNCFWPRIEKITAPLSHIQLREVLAELAYMNALLKARPVYKTTAELETEKLYLAATRPELALKDPDLPLRGRLLRAVLGGGVDHIQMEGHTPAEVAAAVDAGKVTFLFDTGGKFIENAWKPA
jgi:hypothetical protein